MANFKLTDEGIAKIERLPFGLKYIAEYLMEALDSLINGECSEEQVASVAGSLKQNASGRIGKEDTLNYDKAGEILGFGSTNRVGLKKLLDKEGVKQVYINNMPCGFLRSEVMAVRDKYSRKNKKATP